MIIETVFSPFVQAWNPDRPAQGSHLYRVLEPVARGIAEARSKLGALNQTTTATEVVAEIEHLLKVTVLVARVSHQGFPAEELPSKPTSSASSQRQQVKATADPMLIRQLATPDRPVPQRIAGSAPRAARRLAYGR